MILCIKVNDKYYCKARTAEQQKLCVDSTFDKIHNECRMMDKTLECGIGGTIEHEVPELVNEDDLPKDITRDQYNWWYDRSFVDVARMGPVIF